MARLKEQARREQRQQAARRGGGGCGAAEGSGETASGRVVDDVFASWILRTPLSRIRHAADGYRLDEFRTATPLAQARPPQQPPREGPAALRRWQTA